MDAQKVTKVKPPANGRKLWRVRRSVSSGNSSNCEQFDTSNECLQNSLKISAIGTQYTTKRPPLKRPKNRPGMPKDFVFVDLSPVKTESDASSDEMHTPFSSSESQVSTPNDTFDEFLFNESQSQISYSSMESQDDIFSSLDYSKMTNLLGFDDLYDSGNMQSDTNNFAFGLGISGIDWNTPALHAQPCSNVPIDNYCFNEVTQNINQIYPTQSEQSLQQSRTQNDNEQSNFLANEEQVSNKNTSIHKRSKSCSEASKKKSSQGIQFKTYKGPNFSKKRRSLMHRRSNSDPSVLSTPKNNSNTPDVESLDDFLKLGKQLQTDLKLDKNGDPLLIYSPASEYSEFDYNSLGKALKSDGLGCEMSQFMNNKVENFDFNLFF